MKVKVTFFADVDDDWAMATGALTIVDAIAYHQHVDLDQNDEAKAAGIEQTWRVVDLGRASVNVVI